MHNNNFVVMGALIYILLKQDASHTFNSYIILVTEIRVQAEIKKTTTKKQTKEKQNIKYFLYAIQRNALEKPVTSENDLKEKFDFLKNTTCLHVLFRKVVRNLIFSKMADSATKKDIFFIASTHFNQIHHFNSPFDWIF